MTAAEIDDSLLDCLHAEVEEQHIKIEAQAAEVAALEVRNQQLEDALRAFIKAQEAVHDFGVEFENLPANVEAEEAYEALRALVSPPARTPQPE